MLRLFKPDQDEIWQDCSSSEYASIDGGFLIGCHTFKMAAMTSARRSLLLLRLPSACDVAGWLYALQFLIHITFVLVRSHIALSLCEDTAEFRPHRRIAQQREKRDC